MVVQGAVTPGRTRRLMLKLPVGTLRRNSGERVRSWWVCVAEEARGRPGLRTLCFV